MKAVLYIKSLPLASIHLQYRMELVSGSLGALRHFNLFMGWAGCLLLLFISHRRLEVDGID